MTKNNGKKDALWISSLAVVFMLSSALALNEIYRYTYKDTVYPGVRSSPNLILGGLDENTARSRMQKAIDDFKDKGLAFKSFEKEVNLGAGASPQYDPDLAYDFFDFDIDKTAKELMAVGRQGNYLYRMATRFKTLKNGATVHMAVNADKDRIIKALKDNFKDEEIEPQNARIEFKNNNFAILPEGEGGFAWDYESAFALTKMRAASLSNEPIVLERLFIAPSITQKDLKKFEGDLEKLKPLKELILKYEDLKFNVPISEWGNWLTLDEQKNLTLSYTKVSEYLNSIAKDIEKQPRDPKFAIINGKVKEFAPPQDGIKINAARTLEEMNESAFISKKNEIEVTTEKTLSQAVNQDIENFGIKEILGVGTSDFNGSPPNRIHNIKVGAATLNGILIKPWEEFSLLKALGKTDASAGYKAELVIKGDKTVPEYGGGLCQIGTTIFRATMASGLPITKRQNHSFSVPYYLENGLPGTDATIYDPAPDYRFINDTRNHILIQTRVEGTKVVFEFWGTSDEREAERTKPRVWNVTKPAPTKIIETADLKPGQKKCTEKPHNGADAEFTYTVAYNDGTKKEQVFRSHYRAWQEVCLMGVEKTATSTESDIKEMIP